MRPGDPHQSFAGQMLPALAVALFTAVVGLAAVHAPPASGEMGVVFAPWVSQGEAMGAVVAAGGRIVDSSRLPNVIVVYGLDDAFPARVREYGAWFTVAAISLCSGVGGVSNV